MQQKDGSQGDKVTVVATCAMIGAADPRLRGADRDAYVTSSIGRAAVSKTAGWGFESLVTCNVSEGRMSGEGTTNARVLNPTVVSCITH